MNDSPASETAPSVFPADVSQWMPADQKRLDGGRRLCLILGIACVLLMAVPIGHVPGPYPSGGGVVFRWPGRVRLSGSGLFSMAEWPLVVWGVVLLPGIGGALAILASLCRASFARGAVAAVAGSLLMLSGPVIFDVNYSHMLRYVGIAGDQGALGAYFVGPVALETEGRLLVGLGVLIAITVGGHRAAMHARHHPSVRMAALLPAFLALLPVLYCGYVFFQPMLEGGSGLLGVYGTEPEWINTALTSIIIISAFAFLCTVVTALINAGVAGDRVARSGFFCGVVGLPMAWLGLTIVTMYVSIVEAGPGPMWGVGLALHSVLPFASGLVLLIGGYSRMWLWLVGRTAEAPPLVSSPAS